jgi:hypothetical protein
MQPARTLILAITDVKIAAPIRSESVHRIRNDRDNLGSRRKKFGSLAAVVRIDAIPGDWLIFACFRLRI